MATSPEAHHADCAHRRSDHRHGIRRRGARAAPGGSRGAGRDGREGSQGADVRLPADVRPPVPPQVHQGDAGRPPESHVRRGAGRWVRLLRDGVAAGTVARLRPAGRAGPAAMACGPRSIRARPLLRRRRADAARIADSARRGAEDRSGLRPADEEPGLLRGSSPLCGTRLPGERLLRDGVHLRGEAVAVPQLLAAGGRGGRRDRDGSRSAVHRAARGRAIPLPGAVPPPHGRARSRALRRQNRRARRRDGGHCAAAAALAWQPPIPERTRRAQHRLQRQREGGGTTPRFLPRHRHVHRPDAPGHDQLRVPRVARDHRTRGEGAAADDRLGSAYAPRR